MSTLLSLGLAMAFGLLFNRLVKKIGLPNVTGYLLAGLLIGPYCLKIYSESGLAAVDLITTVALGFIAFSIGGEFKLTHIKQIGMSVITITLFQSLAATILVDVVLLLFKFEVPVAITLGAIATATAPAATLMVVRQYKAKGPVTSILLPVVALDDAVGLVIFSISMAIAKLWGSEAGLSVKTMLLDPLIEIVGSLLAGGALGLAVVFCMKLFKSHANRLIVTITAVILGVAVAEWLNLSSLLLCMMIGAMVANLYGDCEELLRTTDSWTPPLFLLFFVISGAELNLSVLPSVGLLGILYIVFRSLGKYGGAYLGSLLEKKDPNIRKYLGFALLPQAGVAIGMCQVVINQLPQYGDQIRAVVLCATLVYELVGPLLIKFVLTKAGEIQPTPKKPRLPKNTTPGAAG